MTSSAVAEPPVEPPSQPTLPAALRASKAAFQLDRATGPSGSPASALPVSLQAVGRCLRAGGSGGGALLQALPPEATIHPDAASSGAIVGLQCACEPASFLEAAVGRVRLQCGHCLGEKSQLLFAKCALPPHVPPPAPPACSTRLVAQLCCRRFLALARAKLYWMVPCWGGPGAEQVPVETQLLLLELEASGSEGCVWLAQMGQGLRCLAGRLAWFITSCYGWL